MAMKKQGKQFKLPQITSKTSSSFSSEQTISNSRTRPLSSNKVTDLEQNLFSQLDQYENLDKKSHRKSKTRKDEKIDMMSQIDAPYLKKLQKLLPDTYNKLISTSKPQPLQQTNKIKTKKRISKQLPGSITSSTDLKPVSSTNISKKNKAPKQQRQMTSFDVAQKQVQAIYQKYLQEEGLTQLNQVYSSKDLEQLNKEINSTDHDLKELRKSFYGLINKFGNDCLDDNS